MTLMIFLEVQACTLIARPYSKKYEEKEPFPLACTLFVVNLPALLILTNNCSDVVTTFPIVKWECL